MPGTQRQQINVYLFNSNVQSFENALADKVDPADHIPVRQISGFDMRLYTRVRNSRRTKWMKLLSDGLEPETEDPFAGFTNRSPAAALIIRKESQFMAATFGQGRYLINLADRVRRFGLIVALNLAPAQGIRKIEARTHSEFTQTRAISNSQLTGLQRFGYDSEEDLLVQVSAKLAANKHTGYTIAGKDVINIVADVSWQNLPIRCDRLARIFRKDWRKTKFADTTNLEPIADPALISRLDRAMCSAIATPGNTDFHLAPYDVILDSDSGLGFGADYDLGRDDPVLELDISRFVASTNFSGPSDIGLFNSNTISYLDQSGHLAAGPWPVSDCIVGEAADAGITYVRSGGQWLALETGYLNRINSIVAALGPDPDLPAFSSDGVKDEADLIDRSLSAYGVGYERLHPRSITWDGGYNRIEFADALADRKLIYAKMPGSARDMSHLLTQAANGIKALTSKEFRDAARAKYGQDNQRIFDLIPSASPIPSEWSVVLLLGVKQARPPQLLPVVQRIALKRLQDELRIPGVSLFLHQLVV